jgi:hypothetical protein
LAVTFTINLRCYSLVNSNALHLAEVAVGIATRSYPEAQHGPRGFMRLTPRVEFFHSDLEGQSPQLVDITQSSNLRRQ